ncbi:MAG: ABC transporter permease [Fimbriimonadales bacterium]|nr:ABC transporter permease [Fimbriimonadales bacterium]
MSTIAGGPARRNRPWRLEAALADRRVQVAAVAAAALLLVLGAFALSGVPPREALRELAVGAFGSKGAWAGTLRETTPLLIAGLSVFVALRAGLFNIGVEGQLVVGAMASVAVCLAMSGPAGVLLGTLAGVAAGALWALPAALIKAYRNGHEVITTIMLNGVANYLSTALVAGPLKDPAQQSPTTRLLDAGTRIPDLYASPPFRVSLGLVVGLVLVAATAWWLRRTVAGFELRATGANPKAARFAGVNTRRVTLGALVASGAIGGLAGAVQALAYEGRFYAGFSPGYGFDSLGVAILAGASPFGLVPSALAFGALAKGSTSIQILGVPKGLSYVILGLLIVVFAVVRYRREAARD